MFTHRFGALTAVVGLVLLGCSSGDDQSGTAAVVTTTLPAATVPAVTEPSVTTVPTAVTTMVPASTTDPSTTEPTVVDSTTTPPSDPTSTTAPEEAAGIDSLVLRADGVGSLRFGTNIVPVLDALAAILGEPLSDAAYSYPEAGGPGFTDQFGDFGFVQPFGRQTCFENEFCVEAGGPSPAELAFVGWSQYEAAAAMLATVDGVTVGSRWSDHPDLIEVDEGGCYSFGTGSIGRIDLALESSGDMFSAPDGAGGFISTMPDPSAVTVVGLSAGDLRVSLFADC